MPATAVPSRPPCRRVGVVLALVLAALACAPAAKALPPPGIYWALGAQGQIAAADYDGTGVALDFVTGGNQPNGVAVDGSHLYWANAGGTTIGRANLDGTGVDQSFIAGAAAPQAVAVDGAHVYWTNSATSTIGRANLDGTGVDQSFITGAPHPWGITVDGAHVYWTGPEAGVIGRGEPRRERGRPGLHPQLGVPGLGGGERSAHLLGEREHEHDRRRQPRRHERHPEPHPSSRRRTRPASDSTPGVYWTNPGSGAIGRANLDGTGVDQTFIDGILARGGIAVVAPVPVGRISPNPPPAFPSTARGTLSAPVTLTVANGGLGPLTITGLSFTGPDPGDFLVTSSTCLGPVAPGQSCGLTVAFAPQAAGARSATLQVDGEDLAAPLTVPLSGTGALPPAEPPAPPGPPGPAGPRGAPAPSGPTQRIRVLVCTTTPRTSGRARHRSRSRRVTCYRRSTFTTTGTLRINPAARATVSRGRVVYGAGARVPVGARRFVLLLAVRRSLAPGRYTLGLRERRAGRWVARRVPVTIR